MAAVVDDPTATDLRCGENTHKLALNEAGSCYVGPLPPPVRHAPPELHERAVRRAQNGRAPVEKYRTAPLSV